MLLFADFLPPLTLPPHCQGPQRGGQLERAGRTRGGASALLPGSPGVRWDQGMEPVSAEGSPLPSRPHGPTPGARRQRSLPPPSLSLRQWRENWVRQSLFSCWLVGGGGGRTAVSPRPAEPSQGRGWGQGTCGLPHPNPHSRWGLRAGGRILQSPERSSDLPLPRGSQHKCPPLRLLPTHGAAACRPHFPGPSHPRKPHHTRS